MAIIIGHWGSDAPVIQINDDGSITVLSPGWRQGEMDETRTALDKFRERQSSRRQASAQK